MSYSTDELAAQIERVIARLDRMREHLAGIADTLEELRDGRKVPSGPLDPVESQRWCPLPHYPPAPCPYPHYPPVQPYPQPPYITWSMTYPPKPEDGTK